MTINDVRNYLNGVNVRDVKFQFVGDLAGIYHQNLLSSQKIRIRHEEFPEFDAPTEPSISANNQPDLNISNGVLQAPKALKMRTM